MIDTIKFKIYANQSQIDLIRSKSKETVRTNNQSNLIDLNYFMASVALPSYNSAINIFYDSFKGDYIFLELSLPKFIWGHNITILSKSFPKYFTDLYNYLFKYFGDFPSCDFWRITRLDICFAWKLPTQEKAEKVLNSLRGLRFPKLKALYFEDSIYFKSENTTVKFYLKHPEFLKHDYQRLNKLNEDFAFYLLDLSIGVLRFEVSLRLDTLRTFFEKKYILTNDITYGKVFDMLDYYLTTFMKTQDKVLVEEQTALNQLYSLYSPQKAFRLYSFWKILHSGNQLDQLLVTKLNRITSWRNRSDLQKANVGLPAIDNYDYDLSLDSNIGIDKITPCPLGLGDFPRSPLTNSRRTVSFLKHND